MTIRLLLLLSLSLSTLILLGCYVVRPRLHHPVAVDVWCDHRPDTEESQRRRIIVHALDPIERVEIFKQDGSLVAIIDNFQTGPQALIEYAGLFAENMHHERMIFTIYFRRYDDYVKVTALVRPL